MSSRIVRHLHKILHSVIPCFGRQIKTHDKVWRQWILPYCKEDLLQLLELHCRSILPNIGPRKLSQHGRIQELILGQVQTAVPNMTQIECKWERTKDSSHLHSIRLMWSTANQSRQSCVQFMVACSRHFNCLAPQEVVTDFGVFGCEIHCLVTTCNSELRNIDGEDK